MKFEWNLRKAATNKTKHGVSFEEALTVFADGSAHIFDDITHADFEPREIIIGHSNRQRLLVVCFVERQDSVRIISARKATQLERHDHEEGTRFQ